ncbi:hypothetical protein HK101_005218 [Irineochytrium annulatum]|nr:hypothetical protein HK101_005218 [Irineochytrium annulatum]
MTVTATPTRRKPVNYDAVSPSASIATKSTPAASPVQTPGAPLPSQQQQQQQAQARPVPDVPARGTSTVSPIARAADPVPTPVLPERRVKEERIERVAVRPDFPDRRVKEAVQEKTAKTESVRPELPDRRTQEKTQKTDYAKPELPERKAVVVVKDVPSSPARSESSQKSALPPAAAMRPTTDVKAKRPMSAILGGGGESSQSWKELYESLLQRTQQSDAEHTSRCDALSARNRELEAEVDRLKDQLRNASMRKPVIQKLMADTAGDATTTLSVAGDAVADHVEYGDYLVKMSMAQEDVKKTTRAIQSRLGIQSSSSRSSAPTTPPRVVDPSPAPSTPPVPVSMDNPAPLAPAPRKTLASPSRAPVSHVDPSPRAHGTLRDPGSLTTSPARVTAAAADVKREETRVATAATTALPDSLLGVGFSDFSIGLLEPGGVEIQAGAGEKKPGVGGMVGGGEVKGDEVRKEVDTEVEQKTVDEKTKVKVDEAEVKAIAPVVVEEEAEKAVLAVKTGKAVVPDEVLPRVGSTKIESKEDWASDIMSSFGF